jgi:hypothetical protein
MSKRYQLILGLFIATYWVACAPKNFEKDPEVNKCQNFSEPCVSQDGLDYFDYTAKANGGLVDILFVNDNSGSMSPEQSQMAQKFSSFLSQLDSRFIDYRIGMITTDISSSATSSTSDDGSSSALYNEPRSINQNGALQDGNLVAFKPGDLPYLTSSTADRESLFASNIQRAETKQCEDFLKKYPTNPPPADQGHANCPSSDERGIFAANLFFSKNPSSFIRPNAHLAIVILSDEDLRSGLYQNPVNTSYQLEANDLPETLVNNVKAAYSGKSLSVHSIIVKPGDTTCESIQSHQMGPASIHPTYGITANQIFGSQGKKYAELTALTQGILGDICANDYGSQLANIGANIVDRLSDITLACSDPKGITVALTPQVNIDWNISGSNLHFSEALPAGTQVRVQYSCQSL